MLAETFFSQKARHRNIAWAIIIGILFSICSVSPCPLLAAGTDFLTLEERKWIQEHDGKIRVAPDPYYPPMEYFDEKGVFRGIAADYIRLIEKKLQCKFQIIRLNSFEEILEKALKGEIDVANTVIKTPERSEYLLFTAPYIGIPNVIVVRNDISRNLAIKDLKDMTGIVYQGGYAIGPIITKQHGIIQARPITNPADALKDLSMGRINVMVENLAVISHYVRQIKIANLRVAGDCDFEDTISFASRKDWPILNQILDKTLKEITPQEREAITGEWIRLEGTSYYQDSRFWFSVLGVLGLIILAAALMYVWNRTLKRQVAIKTGELKLREETLQKTGENFRRSLDDSPLGTRIVSAAGETIYANQSLLDIYGYESIEKLQETSAKERYTPECYVEYLARREKRQRGEFVPSDYEISIVRKDGEVRRLQVFRKEILWNGEPQFQTLYNDVTERKMTELKLTEALSEAQRFREALDQVSAYIYMKDPQSRYVYANRPTLELFGCSAEKLVGCDDTHFFPPETVKLLREVDARVFMGEQTTEEIDVADAEGGRHVYWEIKTPIYAEPERKTIWGLLGISTDVTERKQAEEELKKRENLLQKIFDVLPIGLWFADKNGKLLRGNPAGVKIWGAEPKVAPSEYGVFKARRLPSGEEIAPDDWALAHTLRERVTIVDEMIEIDAFDGKKKVILNYTAPVLDDQGAIQGAIVVNLDITRRKEAEEQLQHTLDRLRKAVSTTVQVMVSAVESRDPYTSGHQFRSADLARAIATEMCLSQKRIDGIRMAGSIHDIGKMSIPAEILVKPTKLSELEFSLIKEHAKKGFEMLKDVESPWPLAEIVYQHHERMDGSGYPRQLKGEEILMEARILAVADVVEAMASHRPYRPAIGLDAALAEIENNKGRLYDADAVDACLRLFRERGFELERT